MPYVITTTTGLSAAHDCQVVASASSSRGGRRTTFYASCNRCGWVGNRRASALGAEADWHKHEHPASRRAVATLDEARDAIFEALCETTRKLYSDERRPLATDAALHANAITESGGTVGPLPDGTTITVERVEDAYLASEATRLGVDTDSPAYRRARDEHATADVRDPAMTVILGRAHTALVVAAFNAAQG